jgi:hypothetical protein
MTFRSLVTRDPPGSLCLGLGVTMLQALALGIPCMTRACCDRVLGTLALSALFGQHAMTAKGRCSLSLPWTF